MKKKKIAFVVAIPGTAQAFLLDHFREFVKVYEVHLVANFQVEDSKKIFENLGIICHSVQIERSIDVIKDLNALRKLTKLLKHEKFDSTHSVTPKAGLLTALASRFAGVPVRIHIFTGQVWATRGGLMRMVLKMMDKIIVANDSSILVDGESQRQFLINEGVLRKSNSRVLADGSIAGVRLERFVVSQTIRVEERKKFKCKEGDVVYIFLGRLNHDKGIGELFEAFNHLAGECPNVKLLLYGTDEGKYDKKADLYPNLKRGENYYYPGSTRTPYNALQGGDVFVLPTWREGFGSSVIEAQALGLPVITSDAYGVKDASVPNETGLRCGVNDPDGLYNCMKTYYEHPELIKQHGAAGRKRVEEKFDNNIVTAAWVDYYHQVVG